MEFFFTTEARRAQRLFFSKIGRCRFLKIPLPAGPSAPGESLIREVTGWFFFGGISRQRKK
jgi:hypothetical protein